MMNAASLKSILYKYEKVFLSTVTVTSHYIKQHNHNEIHKGFYSNAETQRLVLLKVLQITENVYCKKPDYCIFDLL